MQNETPSPVADREQYPSAGKPLSDLELVKMSLSGALYNLERLTWEVQRLQLMLAGLTNQAAAPSAQASLPSSQGPATTPPLQAEAPSPHPQESVEPSTPSLPLI